MKNISIAMASYNGESYIKEQISSILSQMSNDDELVISDDGSTDQTINIILQFSDPRIRLIQGPKNGVIKNFEFAIKNTKGDIIVLADQDDIWENWRLGNIRKSFEGRENFAVYHSKHKTINEFGEDDGVKQISFKRGIMSNLTKNTYIGAMMAFSSNLKPYILPFPRQIAMHDQWIGLVNEMLGGEVILSKNVEVLYRRHQNNLTGYFKISFYRRITNQIKMGIAIIVRYLQSRKMNV